jgi:hypothetical protein
MGRGGLARLRQGIKQARECLRMRRQRAEEVCSGRIGDQQRGKGFHFDIAYQFGFILNVQPRKTAARITRSHLSKKYTVVAAQAAPVGTQADDPVHRRIRLAGRCRCRRLQKGHAGRNAAEAGGTGIGN